MDSRLIPPQKNVWLFHKRNQLILHRAQIRIRQNTIMLQNSKFASYLFSVTITFVDWRVVCPFRAGSKAAIHKLCES